MALPSFTVVGNLFDILGNVDGSEISPNPLGAGKRQKITFTPNVPINQLVVFDDASYRVKPVEAEVMSDGSIKRNGEDVLLLANDDGLSVEGLQWRVDVAGMKTFWFDAPEDGETVDLKDEVGAATAAKQATAQGSLDAAVGAYVEAHADVLAVDDITYSTEGGATTVQFMRGGEPIGSEIPFEVDAVPSADLAAAVAAELDEQTPGAVAAAAPAAVDADISGRAVTIEDAGGGEWVFKIGGVATSTAFTLPAITASAIAAAELVARMDVLPTAGRRALIESLIYDLMVAGVWEKLDGLYVFAAHDIQAARLNWISGGMQDCTSVNSPVFQPDRGFTGDGASAYLDTNTTGAALSKFAQDDASVGVYVRTSNTADGEREMGAGSFLYLATRWNGTSSATRLNSTTQLLAAHGGTTTGLFTATRDDTTAYLYRGATQLGSTTAVLSDIPVNNFVFLQGSGANYSGKQISAGFVGAQLSSGQVDDLNTALTGYLTAVEAIS